MKRLVGSGEFSLKLLQHFGSQALHSENEMGAFVKIWKSIAEKKVFLGSINISNDVNYRARNKLNV